MTPAIRPQPEEASDSTPAPSAAHPGAQIAQGVAGSVAVTMVAKALGGSPWATLAAAVVGASIPVLISYTPRHRHLRLGIVLIVVGVAFALTYGGFTLYDAAADKQTFPRPGPTPTPTASPTPGGGGGGAQASVSPLALTCTPGQCGQVEIASVGDAAVQVGDIAFAEGRSDGFTHDGGCAGRTLGPGDGCTLDVGFDPAFDAGTRSASLVVPTSDGRVANVQLQGSGGEPADFAFAAPPTCALGEGTAATLRFALDGPEGTSPAVGTSVSAPSPQRIGEDVVLPVDLGEPPPVTVLLVIDPDEEFQELDRTDNSAQAQCG